MSESKNIERFSPVKDVLRTKIITDPGRFQGRETDFSSDTVKAIVAKGYYDRSASPIKVWWDDVKDKYVVLAGHSRLAAFDRIHTRYDLSRTIPVIVFQGDEDDAMDYAIIESNRKSTEEGLASDLRAYRRAVESGKSKKYLLSVFKPESKLAKLQKLIHLNPKGRFIEMLSGTSALSFPYLDRNAQWVGDMRSQLPQLSDAHELELFKYIYDGGKGLKLDKAQLYKVVNDRVNRIDFDPAAPLNLQNHVSSSAYVDPINEEIANVTKEIERSKKEIDDKRATIVRAKEQFGDIKKGEGYKLTSPIFKRIDDLNRFILRKIEEREKLKQQAGRVERTVTADLFSEPEAPALRGETLQDRLKKMPEKVEQKIGNYYVTNVLNDNLYLLLGPFNAHQDAISSVQIIKNYVMNVAQGNDRKQAVWGGYGTTNLKTGTVKGTLNDWFAENHPQQAQPLVKRIRPAKMQASMDAIAALESAGYEICGVGTGGSSCLSKGGKILSFDSYQDAAKQLLQPDLTIELKRKRAKAFAFAQAQRIRILSL